MSAGKAEAVVNCVDFFGKLFGGWGKSVIFAAQKRHGGCSSVG